MAREMVRRPKEHNVPKKLDGAHTASFLNKSLGASFLQESIDLFAQHIYHLAFRAKVFLPVRTKRSSFITFLVRL